MDLEQLQDLADKKLKINDTELDLESLKTPQLHNEFLKHLTKFKLLLTRAEDEFKLIKRQKWEYKCVKCKKWHMGKDVNVDHKVPAGTLTCAKDLPGFVERLFCEIDGLQVLCKNCHGTKTQSDKNNKIQTL